MNLNKGAKEFIDRSTHGFKSHPVAPVIKTDFLLKNSAMALASVLTDICSSFDLKNVQKAKIHKGKQTSFIVGTLAYSFSSTQHM
jgi:hypothetical protein